YGVFASAVEPREPPLVGEPDVKGEAYVAFEKELRAREAAVDAFLETKRAEVLADLRRRAGEYLLAAARPDRKREEVDPDSLPAGESNALVVARWREYLTQTRAAHHPVLAPWNAFAALGKDFAAAAPAVCEALARP